MSTCHQAGNAHLVLRRIAVRVRRRLGNGGDNSLDGLLSLLQSLLAVGLSSLNSLLGDIGNLSSGLLGGDDRLLLKDERCQYRLHKAAEQVTPHRGRSAYCGSVEEKVQTLKLTAASSSESEESEESEDSAFFAGAAAVALPLVALGAGLASSSESESEDSSDEGTGVGSLTGTGTCFCFLSFLLLYFSFFSFLAGAASFTAAAAFEVDDLVFFAALVAFEGLVEADFAIAVRCGCV